MSDHVPPTEEQLPAYTTPEVPIDTTEKPSPIRCEPYVVPVTVEYYLRSQYRTCGKIAPYKPSLVHARDDIIAIEDDTTCKELNKQLLQQNRWYLSELMQDGENPNIGIHGTYTNSQGKKVRFSADKDNWEGFLALLKTKEADTLSLQACLTRPGGPIIPGTKTPKQHMAEVEEKMGVVSGNDNGPKSPKRAHRCNMM